MALRVAHQRGVLRRRLLTNPYRIPRWNPVQRFLCYIGKHQWRPLTEAEVRWHYSQHVNEGGPVVFKICDRCHATK